MENHFANLIHVIVWILSMIGVFIITAGAACSIYYFLYDLITRGERQEKYGLDFVRLLLGRSIVFGLEFILAADVIVTVLMPDYYELGIVSILVLIRTVLNYFLTKEIEQLTPEKRHTLS